MDSSHAIGETLSRDRIPKLERADVIAYDDADRTARLRGGHELLFEHLYLSDGR